MTNPAPVVITFVCEGVEEMKSVFASVETRLVQMDRATGRSSEQSARQRVSTTRGEVEQREKEYAKLVKESEKWEKQAVKDAERAASERVRAVETEAERKNRIRENSMRMAHQMLLREVADEKAAAEEKARAEASVRRRYGRTMGRAVTSSLGGTLGTAAGLIGTGLSIGGGFAVADAMRKEMGFEKSVAQTSNMAYIPGVTTRGQVSPAVISEMSKGTQALTNIDKTDVSEGIKRYVGLSSDFEGLHGTTSSGKSGLDELAILSKASGTDFTQLMEAAASIKANNQGMNADGLITSMRQLLGAGKQGTIPLDQLAAHVGMIQASATMYAGGSTTEGLAKNQSSLLGLVQLAGRATGGDAARAAMSVKDFSTDLMKEGHKAGLTPSMLYEGGKSVNGMLAPDQLLANLFEKTKGAPDIAQKALGQRSLPIFEALKPIFDAAEKAKAGTGVAAVQNTVKGFENQSYSAADTMKEFNSVMATNGERIDHSFKQISEVLQNDVTPFLEKFASGLEAHQEDIEKFFNALASVANFMVENPWTSIFGVLEAELVGAIAKAAIAQSIKEAFAGSMSTGIAGSIPLVTGAIAALALAITTGIAAIDAAVDASRADEQKAAHIVGRGGQLAAKIEAGTATPAEVKEAGEIRGKLATMVDKEHSGLVDPSIDNPRAFFGGVEKAFTGDSEIQKQLLVEYKQHTALLSQLVEVTQNNPPVQKGGGTREPLITTRSSDGVPDYITFGSRSRPQSDEHRGGSK